MNCLDLSERGKVFALPHKKSRVRRRVLRAASGSPERWSLKRFMSTVLFFNEPMSALLAPFMPPASRGENQAKNIIVVFGATGGVGANVVAGLLAAGKNVRAVVRSPEKAKILLADLSQKGQGKLDIMEADVTRPDTLTAPLFRDATSIVSATATIIGPKEGDTNDRQKYRQGIKFYEPEVKGQSPEVVEYNGMKNLLQAAQKNLPSQMIIFDPAAQYDFKDWGALDDVVMGGVSQSSFRRSDSGSHAVFSGRVSATNNGGFASIRTKNFSPPLDLSSCNALLLRVKGDGLRYKVSVRTDTNWDGIGYTQSFDTQKDVWQDIELSFGKFLPVFRAKTTPDAPAFDVSHITSIQLMLSKFEYDGKLNPNFQLGEFALPIAKISARLSQPVFPQIVHISSAGVTRPGKRGLDLSQEPPAVRMNDSLGGLLTWKLAAEAVLRESCIPYVIVRPVALTDEPAGADLEFSQGDTIKGKISRADVADLCVSLLSNPSIANTTFEVKSKVPFSEQFRPARASIKRNWQKLLAEAQLKSDQS